MVRLDGILTKPLPYVYIGESDDVANRLKQHNRTEELGGKDFWERVCLVTGKDQNITKESKADSNFYLAVKGLKANARDIDGVFYVLKGSEARKTATDEKHTYTKNLRPQLFESGIIDSKSFLFTQDYEFSSLSAAGAVILGRACNGKKEWKHVDSIQTYGEWLQRQVDNN